MRWRLLLPRPAAGRFSGRPLARSSAAGRLYSTADSPRSSTVDPNEVSLFRRLSDKWWDESGQFAALHSMNKLRIPLIVKSRPLSAGASVDSQTANQPSASPAFPLAGCRVLDVGCGGGLISEPLARLGAVVTGLDVVEENIGVAEVHKSLTREPMLDKNLSYVCGTIEGFVAGREQTYDMVVASEVVEHVASVDTFVRSCSELLRPGGSLVVTTINRTTASYCQTILAAEYLLGMVPRGTHDWEKYISPLELRRIAERHGCEQRALLGLTYNLFRWSWTSDTDINYASTFTKL